MPPMSRRGRGRMKTFALFAYLLVWWQTAIAIQPVLEALDDWAIGRRAVATVVMSEWK